MTFRDKCSTACSWQQVHDSAPDGVALGGWMDHQQCWMLYQEALKLKPGDCVVVIGLWAGSQAILCKLIEPECEVWGIDPLSDEINDTAWKNEGRHLADKYHENIALAGLTGKINLIQQASQDVGPNWVMPIRWLLVDGSHEEADAYQDLHNFAPHVVIGGALFVDDNNSNGTVRIAYNRWALEEIEAGRVWMVEHGVDSDKTEDKLWLLRRIA